MAWIKWKESTYRTAAFYLMISPWFIVFLFMGLYPMLYGLYLSFTNFVGFNIQRLKWVGLQNYGNLFEDTDTIYALGRTLLVTVINVPLGTLIGLLFAILVNRGWKGEGFFRTIFYLPAIVPAVSIGMMWRFMYANEDGIFNNILRFFHLSGLNWLGYDYATMSLIILLLWGAGGGILINLAGLKGIPKELYEAASIDGASAFRRFRNVTVPMMTPVIFLNLILGLIASLQIYLQPILLTGTKLLDSPIRPNYLYTVHAFQQIFTFQRYAYGMALLWVMFIVILILTVVVFSTSRIWVHYEADQEK